MVVRQHRHVTTGRRAYDCPGDPLLSGGGLTGGYSYRSNVTATWDRPGSQDQSTPPTLGSIEGRAGPTSSVQLQSAVLARRGGVVDEDPEWHDRRSGGRIPSHGRRGQYLLAPTVRHRRQRQGVAVAHSGGGTEKRISAPVHPLCSYCQHNMGCVLCNDYYFTGPWAVQRPSPRQPPGHAAGP